MSKLSMRSGGYHTFLNKYASLAANLRDELTNADPALSPAKLGINVPTANVVENRWEYKVELAAPGLERKDFNLEVEDHVLRISAHKEIEIVECENEYSRKEFFFDSFSRTFSLPENILEEGIRAEYENGLLKVVIPKLKESSHKPVYKIRVT